MSRRPVEFPSNVQVECPNCGQINPVALRYAEGNMAEYEGVCEAELAGGRLCGAALMVSVTRTEDFEVLEDLEGA